MTTASYSMLYRFPALSLAASLAAGCSLTVIPGPQTGAYHQEVQIGGQAPPASRPNRVLFLHRTDLVKRKPETNADVIFRLMPSVPTTYGPLEGALELWLVVETNGSVKDVEVVSSCGKPEVDKLYLDAMRRWMYSPAFLDGNAVPQLVRQQFVIKLAQ